MSTGKPMPREKKMCRWRGRQRFKQRHGAGHLTSGKKSPATVGAGNPNLSRGQRRICSTKHSHTRGVPPHTVEEALAKAATLRRPSRRYPRGGHAVGDADIELLSRSDMSGAPDEQGRTNQFVLEAQCHVHGAKHVGMRWACTTHR